MRISSLFSHKQLKKKGTRAPMFIPIIYSSKCLARNFVSRKAKQINRKCSTKHSHCVGAIITCPSIFLPGKRKCQSCVDVQESQKLNPANIDTFVRALRENDYKVVKESLLSGQVDLQQLDFASLANTLLFALWMGLENRWVRNCARDTPRVYTN